MVRPEIQHAPGIVLKPPEGDEYMKILQLPKEAYINPNRRFGISTKPTVDMGVMTNSKFS